jgi:hypothetical protein
MARGRGFGKAAVHIRPDGQVRQSQVLGTFGPGAMIDLLEHAVMVGGLDFWSPGPLGWVPVPEPRLRDAIAERFFAEDRKLSIDRPFFEPPAGDDKAASKFCGVQVLEFPQWFVCQNPDCRSLVRSDGLEIKGGRYHHHCRDTKTIECVPVRFVAACPSGHVEEFPWISFAHGLGDKPRCAAPSLRLDEGATGDFAEIQVVCKSCESSQSLSHAMAKDVLPFCRGERPWLGREGREECTDRHHLRLLVRTASNAYFGQVVSALSVPEDREIEAAVGSVWDVLLAATPELLPAFRLVPKVQAAIGKYTDSDVLAAIGARRSGAPIKRDPLRGAELKQFLAQPAETRGELPQPKDTFFARSFIPPDGLPANVSKLVLAHKLREVRVQIGFTRLEPVSASLQGEFDLEVRSSPLSLTKDWLPATEVRGEGVLLVLDEQAVRQWEHRPAVQDRARELLAGHEAWAAQMEEKPPFLGIRFYMLHSLAHLLTTAIALECGYAASAIRERIYCAPETDAYPMAAILLSTGTSGSEGTLGGLVEQGRHLRAHLRRAYDMGVLCSNDPVCSFHSPKNDQAERHLEGAACHGCLFVAESSCERFNRYLDRALVVPTIGKAAELAFFEKRP